MAFLVITFFALFNHASAVECSIELNQSNLDDLNVTTIDDTQIVTEDDLLFCPGQKLRNSNITPEELPDNGSVWRVGNKRWNDDWEKEYQQWVKDEVHSQLFEELDFPTDCADAAIAIRSIFARINNLPASFNGNHYSNGSKKYRRHSTVKDWSKDNWKEDFKKDKRFKEALGDWFQETGTINLHRDTYQTAVWDVEKSKPASCIAPGTIVLSEGHAEILTFNKNSINPYRLSSSTVPAKVRPLEENIFYFSVDSYHGEESEHIRKTRGYVLWNWSINCKGKFVKVKDEQMPYYSEQQANPFDEELSSLEYDLNKAYQKSLNLSDEEVREEMKKEYYKSIDELELAIEQRQIVVDEAITKCKLYDINKAKDCFYPVSKKTHLGKTYTFKILESGMIKFPGSREEEEEEEEEEESCEGCSPELPYAYQAENFIETTNFEDFFKPLTKKKGSFYHNLSTPNRDERLRNKLSIISDLYYQISYDDRKEIDLLLLDKKIELKNGKNISYYHFKDMFHISPQPWDSEELRWGGMEMHEIKADFYYENEGEFKKYDSLLNSYSEDPDGEKLQKLRDFEKRNEFLLKEKEVIDEYFR